MDIEKRLRSLGVGDESIAVACSGGADSVALVHLLARRRPCVFHVDHGLRDDSAEDSAFVERLASDLGLEFFGRTLRIDVPKGASLEAVAREARYGALADMAKQARVRWVLTAHTESDQAETVLLRLMRGGTIASIAPKRDIFVRPLLDVSGDGLREWLTRSGIGWREDPTNDDLRFERNWVRHVLLPSMQQRRPGVAKVIARAAEATRAGELVLDALAASVLESASSDDFGLFVPNDLPEAIASRVARMIGMEMWRLPDGVAFLRRESALEPLCLPDLGAIVSKDWGLKVRVGDATASSWRWRFPAPEGPLTIRSRQAGDRIRTHAGSRKVQDVLVDAKVPRPLRDLVPVLASNDGALAVVGYHTVSDASGTVIDVEPDLGAWSREKAWIGT